MKKINFPLLIGTVLLIFLSALAFFPENFTTLDPNFRDLVRIDKVIVDGQESHKVLAPPWGPRKQNIMGTDELGRDIYTRLVYGTKPTLKTALMIVLMRVLLAVPLGIIAGLGGKMASSIIRLFNTIFTAVPTLFAAFFILNIKYIAHLQVEDSIIAFAVILTLMGWSRLGAKVEEKVTQISREDFIEGEVAVGKNKYQIALQNIIPHLVPSLISFVFIEVGLIIFLLAQLSILEVFIGPRLLYLRYHGDPGWLVAENPEWASMLSRTVVSNRIGNYWIGIYPALAFTVGILAFNLTGEGLRIEFEKRTSRLISLIRRLGFILSPKIYFQQVSKFRAYYKPVMMKSLCLIMVVTYLTIPPPKSMYSFEVAMAMEHLEELMKPEYEGRLAGYEGSYLAGDYILNQLMEYGLQPYDGENYFQTFSLRSTPFGASISHSIVEEAVIQLTNRDGEISYYHLHDDFTVASINAREINNQDEEGYINLSGRALHREEEKNVKTEKDAKFTVELTENYNILWEYALMNRQMVMGGGRPLYRDTNLVFWVVKDDTHQVFPTFIDTDNSIIAKGDLAEKLQTGHHEVEIRIKAPKLPNNGRNIIAVLPGENWEKDNDHNKKELIIIGASYDGIGVLNNSTSAMRASAAAINLELARVLSQIEDPIEKTIVFAFWDGDSLMNSGSYHFNLQGIFSQRKHEILYLDVGSVSNENSINLNLITPYTSSIESYKVTNDITRRLKKSKVDYVLRQSKSRSFYNIGQSLSLKVSAAAPDYGIRDTTDDRIENINKKQMKNLGQFFIDLVTMDENFR